MRYASIDIGTNTILMLIGDVDGEMRINPLKDFYSVPRIGKSVSTTGRLDDDSVARALDVLTRYKASAEEYHADLVIASATSAVRDAKNRNIFIARVKEECGIDVEIIEGETEARLGFLGAVSGAPDIFGTSLVVDIGGGSTELSYGTGAAPESFVSVNIGAVRITERFFHHNPPLPGELEEAGKFVSEALRSFPFDRLKADRVIAVAGTATTLALIEQGTYEFDPRLVNNYEMSAKSLFSVFEVLMTKSPKEIRKMTNAAEGREDVLLAGALILKKVIQTAGSASFITTDRGLRYGYLLYKQMQLSAK